MISKLKCEFCDFETHRKHSLTNHIKIIHKDINLAVNGTLACNKTKAGIHLMHKNSPFKYIES